LYKNWNVEQGQLACMLSCCHYHEENCWRSFTHGKLYTCAGLDFGNSSAFNYQTVANQNGKQCAVATITTTKCKGKH